MDRSIIWSAKAEAQLNGILQYWFQRNNSPIFPNKLSSQFHETVIVLSKFPHLGRPTQKEGTWKKVVGNYFLLYEFNDFTLKIVGIWDSRRDPGSLNETLFLNEPPAEYKSEKKP